ncbi:MAG: ABC transporter ATP-binding protein [Ruminococcaceae bacterium]|nr:ABC transporter ATP-binding protein [Oscillospiraceae bacterium]
MLKLDKISFSYGKKQVIRDLDLTLKRGELLAVMGASGCGKSTLLHLIAGLRKPTNGMIECNAERIAYVFQEPRLFPWLTVEENLRAVCSESENTDEQITQALALVGLENARVLSPAQLSGGMKSRVSLARALVYGGDLFLLDEPFSALDEALRIRLTQELRNYCKEKDITAILVTHQSSDAELFADRILRLDSN